MTDATDLGSMIAIGERVTVTRDYAIGLGANTMVDAPKAWLWGCALP